MTTHPPLAASDLDQLPIQHTADTWPEVATRHVLADIAAERRRQDRDQAGWSEWIDDPNSHDCEDGTGTRRQLAARDRRARIIKGRERYDSWCDALTDAYLDTAAEADPDRLRTALIRLAAVVTSWVEAIDRRPL